MFNSCEIIYINPINLAPVDEQNNLIDLPMEDFAWPPQRNPNASEQSGLSLRKILDKIEDHFQTFKLLTLFYLRLIR